MGDTIEIIQGTATTIEIAGLQGPQGQKGDKGDVGSTGAQGPAGTGIETLTTKGDLLYRDTSVAARLPIGTSGQILKVAASGIPEWGAAPASGVSSVNTLTGAVMLDAADVDAAPDLMPAVYVLASTDPAYAPLSGYYYRSDTAVGGKAAYYKIGSRENTSITYNSATDEWFIKHNASSIWSSMDDPAPSQPWEVQSWAAYGSDPSITVSQADTVLFTNAVAQKASGVSTWSELASKPSTFAPSAHAHGNLTNDGKLGTTANLPVKTGTNGVIEAGSFGTSAGNFCEGNDARLSDARTPAAHKSSHATSGTDALAPSDIGAQSIFVTEALGTITANVTLTAARAKIYTINTTTSGLRILLPTTGVMAGDVVIIEFLSSTGQTLTPVRGTMTGFFVDALRFSDRATFIAASSDGASWYEDRSISRFNAGAIFDGTVAVARLPVGTGSTQVAAGNHTHVVADVTGAAASGPITTSGLTQSTARILGRTTASTGAVEEIQIGAGLSLSAGELSSTVSAGIPATLLDAKGDLIVASAADTAARLPVGATNGHVLTVDSAEATGMKWAAAAGGIGGSTGSTANAVLRASGTGGSTAQASGLVIEDTVTAFTSITGDAATDIITATGSAFANGQRVRFTALTGGSGLNTTTNYLVINASGATFQLSTTQGGSASLFTTNITAGTLLTGHAVQSHVQISNTASDTNSALVLTPKGTGAFVLGAPANAGAGGGNSRGQYAVDLQFAPKFTATNVASGDRSAIVAGENNTASGGDSFVCGTSNIASGVGATACGGLNNDATGNYSFVAGARNIASASNASIAIGGGATASIGGQFAFSSGRPSSKAAGGISQFAIFTLYGNTTTNSAVELFGGLDNSGATRFSVPSGHIMTGLIFITGARTNGTGGFASYCRQFSIKNVAGTTSLIGTVNLVGTDEAAGTSINITANDTNDSVKVECTGVASEDWKWTATIQAAQRTYAI